MKFAKGTRLSEAVSQVAASLVPGNRAALEAALEQDKTKSHGRVLGLTDEKVEQLTAAWLAYFRGTPYPVDWDRIRRAQLLTAAHALDPTVLAHGASLGLSDAGVRHIVQVWVWHGAETGESVDSERLKASLTAYAGSGDWRP